MWTHKHDSSAEQLKAINPLLSKQSSATGNQSARPNKTGKGQEGETKNRRSGTGRQETGMKAGPLRLACTLDDLVNTGERGLVTGVREGEGIR